jgi:uroporphyrinogen decarboxylase
MSLYEYFSSLGRFGVVPILGYAGLRSQGITAKECFLNPEAHAKTVVASVEQFEPDAALPLLDLTVEAESYGLKPTFKTYDAPEIRSFLTIESASAIEPARPESTRIALMIQTARLLSMRVATVPKGFFTIGPFTLAGQVVGVQQLLIATVKSKAAVRSLIENCTRIVADYARLLEQTGIDFLVMADPTSGLISVKDFQEFAKAPIEQVVKSVSKELVLHICGRSGHLLEQMVETGVAGISLDQNVALADAAGRVPDDVLVFGNYPPTNLPIEAPSTVHANVQQMLSAVSSRQNVVASTGCDIPSTTPPEVVQAFVKAAKSQKKYRN